jgi:hypothetical protein
MTRFLVGLVVLLLMGVQASIVAALGANVVGFTLPPVLVIALIALSPFLLLIGNGLPSLMSLLPAEVPVSTPKPPLVPDPTPASPPA